MGPSPAYEERVRNDPKRWLPYAIGSGHAQLVLEVLNENHVPSSCTLERKRYAASRGCIYRAARHRRVSTGDGCKDGLHNRSCPQPLPARSDNARRTAFFDPQAFPSPDWLHANYGPIRGQRDVAAACRCRRRRRRLHKPQKDDSSFPSWKEPYDTAELLLANGANVNSCSKNGYTVLHLAARAGSLKLVELFLAHGASASAQTRGRQTPWAFAVIGGHREVAALLLSK